jgi:hypothetical protein
MYFFVRQEIVRGVRELVPRFVKGQWFSGPGGRLLKEACCYLIEKCSMAGMPYRNRLIIGKLWLNFIFSLLLCCLLCIETYQRVLSSGRICVGTVYC